VRLIEPSERERWDRLITQRHYLGNACLVGRQLRYVAEVDGAWVGLLGWSTPAYHLRGREAWIGWSVEQHLRRRKFVAQNSRYLLLVERGRYPNLASRVLSLCTQRLRQDWEEAFGYGVLVAESFVDPQRFSGACYRAAGWERLGVTAGYRRHHRDFYEEDGHPKELWVRRLHPKALKWLRAPTMPPRWACHEDEAVVCPYKGEAFRSLWEHFQALTDRRRPNGRRHRMASVLAIAALGTLCGGRGTRAIADFAEHLNQTQRRLLRCYWSRKRQQYEAPSEPTIRRILKSVPAAEFDQAVIAWMARHDPEPVQQVAVDGKTIKQARAADGRPVHVVAAVTTATRRLWAQRPVAEKSNEITALRPLLEPLALKGVVVSADALHAQQDAARFLVQEKGAEYFFTLKGNQPSIQAQAEKLLGSAFPPSGGAPGPKHPEATRTGGGAPALELGGRS